MIKVPVCPRHKEPISLSNKQIILAGLSYDVCVGTCPKCSVKYISQRLMSCASIMIEGQKYEYLSGLSSAHEISKKAISGDRDVRGEKMQNMGDIEQFFLTAEKDRQQQEELENLRKQNDSLNEQLKEVEIKAAEAIKFYDDRIAEIQVKHQEELRQTVADYQASIVRLNDIHKEVVKLYNEKIAKIEVKHREDVHQIVQELEEKHQKELEKIALDYQAQIARLQNIHKESADVMRRSAKTNLEVERQRIMVLQSDNAKLKREVAELTKQLHEAKRPSKKIIFVDEKLYVCGGTIKCEKYNHQREEVTGVIDTMQGKPIAMTVCHCKDCNLYYVRDAVFESYREKHGTLLGKFIRKRDGMSISQVMGYGELAIESILHMNGYNVNQTDDLSSSERHKILTYVIESGIMSKHDIRSHLAYLVKMNQSNPSKDVAVSRWRSDIRWINDYHSGTQDTVWLSGTAMYKYRRK